MALTVTYAGKAARPGQMYLGTDLSYFAAVRLAEKEQAHGEVLSIVVGNLVFPEKPIFCVVRSKQ